MLYLGFRDNNIQFIDEVSFLKGKMNFDFESTKEKRSELAVTRLKALKERQLHVAGSNRLVYHTDASKGVVPLLIVVNIIMSRSLFFRIENQDSKNKIIFLEEVFQIYVKYIF
ncbi:hypothetical protein J2S74_000642 [Evansella vedderi]|uniref:Uncharacterized protein n=2 Tax=Evansella vedderi TaxID=38282 RepID=A0ABT9ZSW9_9BACI|nr:hypothetical protein [Evansella vedderi]